MTATTTSCPAHSTGGLTFPLWANQRRRRLAGMVLNSPWFDLQGAAWSRSTGAAVAQADGARQPMREIKRT